MVVRDEALGAARDPPHRTPQPPRRPGDDRFLRIELALVAEGATDVGRDHAHRALGHAELLGHLPANVVGSLGGAVERELLDTRLAEREHRAWLDRRADQAVVDEIERHDMGCPTKTFPHGGLVAAPPAKAHIGRGAGMQLRGISRLRGTRIGDRGERLIVDLDTLGRIRCRLAGLGDRCCHRLADMAHGVACQRKARRLGHRRAVVRADDPERSHRSDIVGRHVRAAEDRNDAGQSDGGSRIDTANAGVGVRRTHEHAVQGTGHIDVGDVSAMAEKETPILDAAQRQRRCLAHYPPLRGRDRVEGAYLAWTELMTPYPGCGVAQV